MEIPPEFISRVTTLPLGLPWRNDEKPIRQAAKKNFFQNNEHAVEDKNGIRRDTYHMLGMKLVTISSNTFPMSGGTT